MELVIGGAYQGKTRYAKETFNKENFTDGATCTLEELATCEGVSAFHEFLKRVMQGEFKEDVVFAFDADLTKMEAFSRKLVQHISQKNPGIIIVSNELGYGVVPMVREDRMWRELCGRVCTQIAKESNSVTRVVCGLGMRLK